VNIPGSANHPNIVLGSPDGWIDCEKYLVLYYRMADGQTDRQTDKKDAFEQMMSRVQKCLLKRVFHTKLKKTHLSKSCPKNRHFCSNDAITKKETYLPQTWLPQNSGYSKPMAAMYCKQVLRSNAIFCC
jgi:hypothetical protein